MPVERTTLSKTQLRQTFKSREFSAREVAEALSISVPVARREVARLADEGALQSAGTRKHTDAEGKALRGRPVAVFKVASKPRKPRATQPQPEPEASDA